MGKTDTVFNSLFSSLIQDIKSYSGTDPLLPWLRGIKKMKGSLPANLLKEKLPRFLQKCTQAFESDRRYRNDMRYLRVWLELMDFVDDPRALLRTMEANRIGTKRSLFYQAYALYYEKLKKFEEAEKMYHLGVQNLAEPAGELQKSFEQFLHRMERHNQKKIQEQRTSRKPLSAKSISVHSNENEDKSESSQNVNQLTESNHVKVSATSNILLGGMKKEHIGIPGSKSISKQKVIANRESNEPRISAGDDTVVVKFVDTAIVGKSETEDACHHGLVDPTVNMKEAMNAINSMFREPLDMSATGRRSRGTQKKENDSLENGFEVFIDEDMHKRIESSDRGEEKGVSLQQHDRAQISQPQLEPFRIFVDDEGSDETGVRNDKEENFGPDELQNLSQGSTSSATHLNGFVFTSPNDLPSESSDDLDAVRSPRAKLREDTVVHRFVGSAILDEPEVENVCHHGLVDPTINLKEAMDDINNMFGKPIDFVRAKRLKKQEKAPVRNQDPCEFSVLPDDDLEPQRQPPPKSSSKSRGCDFFEPTMFTKEAMDEINKMFGMPLNF
ncbi:Mitotic spindle checkpoint protein Bub1/Mad [Melia azedarach]|uniref:Mitotic spindle checkpoint protein Bub1/Mad n=1 Tax=Melia azedarach TaxID=155640 RepID=A0ACC1Y8M6_MELAZ|nr:Mitotic spindle checkpoint protein Bub1/Mad [Melia azedarach]